MKYKAIISDLDDTLAPLTLYVTVDEKVKTAIQTFEEKGYKFSIATGKPFMLVKHVIDVIGLQSPVIVDNGAAIYSPSGKVIWESVISQSDLQMIYSIAKKYERTHIKASSGKESFMVKGDFRKDIGITKFLYMGSPIHEAEQFIADIEKNLKDIAVVRATSYEGEGYTDVYVTNAEATKQHSVLKLSEILNIPTDEIVGIGDGYNDFPLLMACGYKVAMGNAVDELKEIADYIAPSVQDDGVADVIQKLFL